MRDALWARQKDLATGLYPKLAGRLRLNLRRFEDLRTSADLARRIDDDVAEARAAGVSGPPTLFINGLKYEGASRKAADLAAAHPRRLPDVASSAQLAPTETEYLGWRLLQGARDTTRWGADRLLQPRCDRAGLRVGRSNHGPP